MGKVSCALEKKMTCYDLACWDHWQWGEFAWVSAPCQGSMGCRLALSRCSESSFPWHRCFSKRPYLFGRRKGWAKRRWRTLGFDGSYDYKMQMPCKHVQTQPQVHGLLRSVSNFRGFFLTLVSGGPHDQSCWNPCGVDRRVDSKQLHAGLMISFPFYILRLSSQWDGLEWPEMVFLHFCKRCRLQETRGVTLRRLRRSFRQPTNETSCSDVKFCWNVFCFRGLL